MGDSSGISQYQDQRIASSSHTSESQSEGRASKHSETKQCATAEPAANGARSPPCGCIKFPSATKAFRQWQGKARAKTESGKTLMRTGRAKISTSLDGKASKLKAQCKKVKPPR